MGYGKLLQSAREKVNLSRREVARQCNISEAFLRFIETGQRSTTPDMLRRISFVLSADEKPIMMAWLKEKMPEVDYNSLITLLPKGINLKELVDIYSIKNAKEVNKKIQCMSIGHLQKLSSNDMLQLRASLNNCLCFIQALESEANTARS